MDFMGGLRPCLEMKVADIGAGKASAATPLSGVSTLTIVAQKKDSK
jgi:hypothetical protein